MSNQPNDPSKPNAAPIEVPYQAPYPPTGYPNQPVQYPPPPNNQLPTGHPIVPPGYPGAGYPPQNLQTGYDVPPGAQPNPTKPPAPFFTPNPMKAFCPQCNTESTTTIDTKSSMLA